jgi:hypothetical protein
MKARRMMALRLLLCLVSTAGVQAAGEKASRRELTVGDLQWRRNTFSGPGTTSWPFRLPTEK